MTPDSFNLGAYLEPGELLGVVQADHPERDSVDVGTRDDRVVIRSSRAMRGSERARRSGRVWLTAGEARELADLLRQAADLIEDQGGRGVTG